MNLILTTSFGVESIAKKEIERLGYKINLSQDRMIGFEAPDSAIARINLWSRVGNKVYLELAKAKVSDFDELFDLVYSIDWKKYGGKNREIVIDAVSVKSILNSLPTIQKITKKSVVSKITGSRDMIYFEDKDLSRREVLVFIENNIAKILLNTSGSALHKRGYRRSEHEAGIKESLAAALVLLSSWKFREPFYDFFCGSGTLLIEAALIARNIAPGLLGRNFAFEDWDWYDKKFLNDAIIEAKSKIFDKKFELYGSDIDEKSVVLAQKNVANAGLTDIIKIEKKDFEDWSIRRDLVGTLVSNPPYGLRLNGSNLASLYQDIVKIYSINPGLGGGFITNYFDFEKRLSQNIFKKRKLYNGGEMCYFFSKMG